jgi:hypothetical protein
MTEQLFTNDVTCVMTLTLAKASKTAFGAVPLTTVIHLSCNARDVSGVHLVIETNNMHYHLPLQFISLGRIQKDDMLEYFLAL